MTHNPLSAYYRAPKLYTKLPSQGKFYSDQVLDMPDTGELPVYAMTAKDEMIMKNPDALLNGEAVATVISSCVPSVKKPRELISNDVETLLVAIQGATGGDEVEVTAVCPSCSESVTGVASIQAALETMTLLEKQYTVDLHNGLSIVIKPFSYNSTVKAGVANFHSTRSLQSLQNITDEMEQLAAFNENFMQIAALNFDLIVDSVDSISGTDSSGEQFVVTNRDAIREFLENSESSVGRAVEQQIEAVNNLGINKTAQLMCEKCDAPFETEIGFDPVNFFTAS